MRQDGVAVVSALQTGEETVIAGTVIAATELIMSMKESEMKWIP